MKFKFIKRFLRDEDGATAIEYGLIVALIALGIIVGLRAIGEDLSTVFNNIATEITPVVGE